MIYNLLDPIEIVGDSGIDTGNARLPTPDTPRHYSRQLPATMSFADHWTAAIAFASVLSFLSTSTNESWMKIESWA